MILVWAPGAEARAEWCRHLGEFLPRHEALPHDDPAADPARARYALAWEPAPGWLASLPGLEVVFSLGAAVDHVTADPAWPRGVPLVRMGGGETAQRMAEYVAWACLHLLRDGRRFALAQAARRWDYAVGPRTAETTRVGIMGLGSLGAACVPALRGLGFPVSGWSRNPKSVEGVACRAGPGVLDAFLAESDLLVCLLPPTEETRGILDARALLRLPRGAGVVNAARGMHLVVPDLLAALDSGHLSGAVLDAFEEEPLPADSPLWNHPRVTVTPHVASIASRRSRARFVADAVLAHEAGGPLPNLYDPERGY